MTQLSMFEKRLKQLRFFNYEEWFENRTKAQVLETTQ